MAGNAGGGSRSCRSDCLSGTEVYYGFAYHVSVTKVLLNLIVMILVYAGFTMLGIYPERTEWSYQRGVYEAGAHVYDTNGACCKADFCRRTLVTSICDAMGKELPVFYTVAVLVLMVVDGIIL